MSYNEIEAAGTERLAGVLAQCRALAHLDLGFWPASGSGGGGGVGAREEEEEEEPALLAMASKLSGKGGFKLRGVVMSLVFI